MVRSKKINSNKINSNKIKKKRKKKTVRKKKIGGNKQILDYAVIVEPRKHDKLIPVILNFIKFLPNYTKIKIFHGTRNLDFINKNLNKYILNKKIELENLNVENLTEKDYNNLFVSKNFWNKINGENILIFQTDSCLCSKSELKIESFLNYDYVGAPWKNGVRGGNGGLSLRKKSKMLEIICNNDYDGINEDSFFSKYAKIIPDNKLSAKFSVETKFYDKPIGIHKSWHHLDKNEIQKLEENCPEIKMFSY